MANDGYSDLQHPDSEYTDVQDPLSPYDQKNSNVAGKQPAPTLKTPVNGEVTILASFVWSPPISATTETDYFLNHKWHPSFADYVEITGLTPTSAPADFIALMGAITEFKPRSIKRLNFFTHSNKKVIGISGTIDDTDVTFTKDIDEAQIASYAASGLSFSVGSQTFSLDDVRGRFTDDAIFVLYGCDIAFDPTTLLTALKDLLKVSVVGFKDKNAYCPPAQTAGTPFNRTGEKIGVLKSGFSCASDSTRDWRSLINDPNAVKVAK
jgi:hypothetical protein